MNTKERSYIDTVKNLCWLPISTMENDVYNDMGKPMADESAKSASQLGSITPRFGTLPIFALVTTRAPSSSRLCDGESGGLCTLAGGLSCRARRRA